jgi:hypothetical protein
VRIVKAKHLRKALASVRENAPPSDGVLAVQAAVAEHLATKSNEDIHGVRTWPSGLELEQEFRPIAYTQST